MSAFAVIYEHSGAPGDPCVFAKVMERLCHRGPDGRDDFSLAGVTMGHWHFWTTPEEVGERQPLHLGDLPFTIVLDGRIDNRSEIILQLGPGPAEAGQLSDAALILMAYRHWGKACFERFVGEFALVIFNKDENELVCARDHLGDRTLFFAFNDARFVIASEPWAVFGSRDSVLELNESTIAHFLAIQVPEDGQTFFAGVHELLPAHAMVVNTSGHTIWRYWQPDPSIKVRFKTDKEYADHFLALLEESVRCRLRSTAPVGVLMSGGLDSTSVACLAARMLLPRSLTTISNVYNELSECDERQYIDAVKEQWHTNSIQMPFDDNWTFKDWEHWPHNPNQPEGNVYRLGLEQDYKRAQDEGVRILLTGEAGDPLYIAGQEWLADFLLEGRFHDAWRGFQVQVQNKGLRYIIDSGHLRSIVRALLREFTPWLLDVHRRQKAEPVWLRPMPKRFFEKRENRVDRELERYSTLLGSFYAYTGSRETINASRYNIELRYPYRDRRLVEFMISIPAYLLHYGGMYKHILRVALRGILPEIIRTRKKATSLSPLFFRGIEREKKVLQDNLYGDEHAWLQFVDPNWLLKRLNALETPEKSVHELYIAWLCISYGRWQKLLSSSQLNSSRLPC